MIPSIVSLAIVSISYSKCKWVGWVTADQVQLDQLTAVCADANSGRTAIVVEEAGSVGTGRVLNQRLHDSVNFGLLAHLWGRSSAVAISVAFVGRTVRMRYMYIPLLRCSSWLAINNADTRCALINLSFSANSEISVDWNHWSSGPIKPYKHTGSNFKLLQNTASDAFGYLWHAHTAYAFSDVFEWCDFYWVWESPLAA